MRNIHELGKRHLKIANFVAIVTKRIKAMAEKHSTARKYFVNFGLLFSPNYFVSGHAAYIFLNSSTTFSKVSVFKKSGPSALVSGLA